MGEKILKLSLHGTRKTEKILNVYMNYCGANEDFVHAKPHSPSLILPESGAQKGVSGLLVSNLKPSQN